MDNSQLSQLPGWALLILIVAVIWSLFWKGAALWQAARKGDGAWFVILLLVNTIGILDIFYLYCVAKVKTDKLFR